MGTETKRIEIFRLGRHTDVNGVVVEFGQAEAEGLIAGYDAGANPAPMVVGHPSLDAPAYGWVTGLALDGDAIVAECGQIEPQFAELHRAGRFKKVSATFYPPAHSANPKPDSWYLKHVGFLGAAAPAVKGLKLAQFAADIEGAVTIETTKETTMSDEDKLKTAQFAEDQGKLKAERQQLDADKAAFEAKRKDALHADHVSFAEGLVASAKLSPAGKDIVVGVLDALVVADKAVSFGEAGELTPAAAMKSLFDQAKPLVAFGEAAPKAKGSPEDDPAAIGREARAFAEDQRGKGITINAADAVRHVLKKGN